MKTSVELSVEELAIIASALRHACIEIEDEAAFVNAIGAPRSTARELLDHLVDVLEIWQ